MRRGTRRGTMLVTTLSAILGAAGPAGAQVSDGSFETGFATAGSWTTYFAGGTFGGWTVAQGSVDLVNGFWQAKDGTQAVDMTGSSAGTIFQTLTLTPGQTYDLSFWMSGNGSSTKTLDVYFGALAPANLVGSFSWTGSAAYGSANMEWTEQTLSGLVATSASMPLYFVSTVPGVAGAAIDLVSLTPSQLVTPEPGTVALVAGGLVGMGAAARRRRRS